jgi:isopenicillin N synthase-like dioxygenase
VNISYKASGANAVDASGKLDCAEFINVAKDDALAWPQQARRAYPSTVNARMESTISPFVRKSLEVNNTLLQAFESKLGFPAGTLMERHKMEEFSGSETRVIRTPPCPADKGQLIGSHSDFGSLVRFLLHPTHSFNSYLLVIPA